MAVVTVPEALLEKLREASKAQGISVGELIVEKLAEGLNPKSRAEIYWKMAEEYLKQADDEIAEGDFKQASEKIWGAAALAVKASAYDREGERPRSHGELWSYVDMLVGETGDEELGDLWKIAMSMHVNFYEDWAPKGEVERSLKRVKTLLDKMKKLR